MLKDQSRTIGTPTITLYGPDGKIKQQFTVPNLIVQSGRDWMAARKVGDAAAVMSHMAIGTGTTAPALGNTALEAEVSRRPLTSIETVGNVTTYEATFGQGHGTGAITEAAIFNAAADGTMYNRTTFPVVNKQADDSMAITWAVTSN